MEMQIYFGFIGVGLLMSIIIITLEQILNELRKINRNK